MPSSINTSRLKRDLSRDAIAFALEGEWERASEVNRALLELSGNDVEAMNRLSKALIELGRYSEAREVLGSGHRAGSLQQHRKEEPWQVGTLGNPTGIRYTRSQNGRRSQALHRRKRQVRHDPVEKIGYRADGGKNRAR